MSLKTAWLNLQDSLGNRFAWSHVNAVYYNWAQKKLLKEKLDDIDTAINAKVAKTDIVQVESTATDKVPSCAYIKNIKDGLDADIAELDSNKADAQNPRIVWTGLGGDPNKKVTLRTTGSSNYVGVSFYYEDGQGDSYFNNIVDQSGRTPYVGIEPPVADNLPIGSPETPIYVNESNKAKKCPFKKKQIQISANSQATFDYNGYSICKVYYMRGQDVGEYLFDNWGAVYSDKQTDRVSVSIANKVITVKNTGGSAINCVFDAIGEG